MRKFEVSRNYLKDSPVLISFSPSLRLSLISIWVWSEVSDFRRRGRSYRWRGTSQCFSISGREGEGGVPSPARGALPPARGARLLGPSRPTQPAGRGGADRPAPPGRTLGTPAPALRVGPGGEAQRTGMGPPLGHGEEWLGTPQAGTGARVSWHSVPLLCTEGHLSLPGRREGVCQGRPCVTLCRDECGDWAVATPPL